MRFEIASFLRFLLVGGSATVVQYSLFVGGVNLELAPTVVVSGVSYLIAGIFNFFLSRSFTFRSRGLIGPAAIRFGVMIAIGLLLNTVVMMVLLRTGLHYLVCQLVATGVIILWNYTIAANWVFPADREEEDRRPSSP